MLQILTMQIIFHFLLLIFQLLNIILQNCCDDAPIIEGISIGVQTHRMQIYNSPPHIIPLSFGAGVLD